MSSLVEADRVEVLVLVDNVTDNLSSTPLFVENEWPRLWKRGMRALSGRCLCCAAHGLSCAITVWRGARARTLLFDTGPDEVVFERNVERLGFDVASVEGIVLSHGHWDHCGAMLRALQMIRSRNGGRDVPTYMHPDMYRTRATKAADGSFRLFEDVPSAAQLTQHGAEVVHSTRPQLVLEDRVYVSGEIPRVTPFEIGLPGQHRKTDDGSGWEPDPLIMDERFVAVAVKNKGLVVFTACSHAGVINVLKHARELLSSVAPVRRAGRLPSLRNKRACDPRHRRGTARIRPLGDRRRPLHRLARDRRAGKRLWRCGRAVGGRKALQILNPAKALLTTFG